MTRHQCGYVRESARSQGFPRSERRTRGRVSGGYRNRSVRLRFPRRKENLKRATLVLLPTASGSAQHPRDQFARCHFARTQVDYLAGSKGYGDRAIVACDMMTGLHRLLVNQTGARQTNGRPQ
jgi:hypothetical protein